MRVPRPLEKKETAESLGQWKNLFTNYTQRDPIFSPFLTCKWRRELPMLGFTNIDGGLTAAEQKANCELFLSHIASFLKEPYWNNKILKRTSDLNDVWIIFDEIFNFEHNADSLLDIASMKYDSSAVFWLASSSTWRTTSLPLRSLSTTCGQEPTARACPSWSWTLQ